MLQDQALAGYKTIELIGWSPHLLMDENGVLDVREVRRKAEEAELRIGAFVPEAGAYNYRLGQEDPELSGRSRRYFAKACEATRQLGAKVMLVSCLGGTYDQDSARVFGQTVRDLQQLSYAAQDCGITLAVKTNAWNTARVFNTLPELVDLLAAVDSTRVQACLDTIAMADAGETPTQWFDALGGAIAHVQLDDGRPEGRLVWGDGLLPLERYLLELEDHGYRGLLGLAPDDSRYLFDPNSADRRNLEALRPYLCDGEAIA